MRVMMHSPPPWAPSGYGKQVSLLALALKGMGHEVGISAYAGVHLEEDWHGIPIMNCGGKEYGNGLIPYNYRRFNADCVVLVCDAFSIEPGQLKGLNVFNWMPIDIEPLGKLDRLWLEATKHYQVNLHPVAMSKFGQRMLADAGYQAAYIPHAYDPAIYSPGDGLSWKVRNNLPADCFLISLVGVNGGTPERKCFTQQMQAFKMFSDKHRKAAMYIHTQARHNSGINLIEAATALGLQGRLQFADEELRNADAYDEQYMAGMFRASAFYTQTSLGEGFGVPVLEAQACGIPSVVTRASAQTELVPNGTGKLVNGDRYWSWLHDSWWTIPRVDEIYRAYEFMFSAPSMQKACLKNAEQYQIQNVAPMWAELLETI